MLLQCLNSVREFLIDAQSAQHEYQSSISRSALVVSLNSHAGNE